MEETEVVTIENEPSYQTEKVIQVKRVSKKTKGGNRLGITALVAVGDRNGNLGIGLGKAKDVRSAVEKGTRQAKNSMIAIPLNEGTIPHGVVIKNRAAHLIMKPAPSGTGVIAGGALRILAELAGISDISVKIVGTRNTLSTVYTAMEAFQQMSTIKRNKTKEVK